MSRRKRRVIPIKELAGGPLIESATEGTPLACALIAGAYIENALGDLLTKVLIPASNEEHPSNRLLNSPYGILGPAGARADACYCLGLIDEITYANAKGIAAIRNQFAHSHLPIDFDDEEVIRLCNGLKEPPLVDKDDRVVDKKISDRLWAKPRQKLVMTASATFSYIAIVCHYTKYKSPVDHRVRWMISEDGTSIVGTTVFFSE